MAMSAEDQKLLGMLDEYLELMKQVPAKDRLAEDEQPCPNCGGDGTVVRGTRAVPSCCGRPTSTGECCGNAAPEPEPIYGECQQCDGSGIVKK